MLLASGLLGLPTLLILSKSHLSSVASIPKLSHQHCARNFIPSKLVPPPTPLEGSDAEIPTEVRARLSPLADLP